MTPNKLYLFYPTSFIGFLICLVTRTRWAHAAVEVDGVLYDASESRGDFNVSDIDVSTRRHVVFEFYGDLTDWLADMKGRKYDYKGVIGWIFKANDYQKVYCFEAALRALLACNVALVRDHTGREQPLPSNLSGHYLMLMMNQYERGASKRYQLLFLTMLSSKIADSLDLTLDSGLTRVLVEHGGSIIFDLEVLRADAGLISVIGLASREEFVEEARQLMESYGRLFRARDSPAHPPL